MASNFDKITKNLQEIAVEKYSQRIKDNFFDTQNTVKIEKSSSHAYITGARSLPHLLKMPLVFYRHAKCNILLGDESGIS